MSVVDDVAFGLRIAGMPRRERRAKASKALELVGLKDLDNRKPSSLSGGMRQRVGLARALVMDTPILLMDEPFSALDPLIREEMQQELLRLQATLNKTIVFVTHDPNEAATLGDRIAILLKGEVVQEGSPMDIVLSPANDYVRNFVKGIDVFKVLTAGQVMEADEGFQAAEWEKQDVVKVGADDLIAPYLDRLSSDSETLAVVRDDGSFAGQVTGASLLKALAARSRLRTGSLSPLPSPARRAGKAWRRPCSEQSDHRARRMNKETRDGFLGIRRLDRHVDR